MTDNSRVIASQDLTTAGFYDMADEWSTSRKIEKYGAFRTRDSYVEASSISDLVNGDKVIVTWADQGTHLSTIGDVGSNAGQTPNSGYYVYNSGLQKLVRTAPLEPEVAKGFSDISTAKAQQVTESQNAITTIKTDIDTKYSTIVSANTNVNTKASQVTADKDIVSQLKNDTLVIRNEALGFSGGKIKATYTEAAAITGLNDGDIVAVLASDTGTHASVSGDVGVSGGQTPNSGYYKYTTAVTALVRVGDLEAVIAINEADRAEAATSRGEQAVSLAVAEAPNLFTAAELEFTSKVLITGNADTVAERVDGLGAWKLTSGAGQAKSWTRRFARSAFGTAEKISASILFQKADAASAGTGVGRFLLQQRDASLVEISGTRSTVNFCTQTGLSSPYRGRHENIALHADCAFVDLYLDLSAVGSAARSVWFREMLGAAGPNSGFRWSPKVDKPDVVWVSSTGSDSNAGTQAAPFLTINAAADALKGIGEIRLAAGSYSWTSNGQRLDPTKVKDIVVRGERGLTAGAFDDLPLIRLAAKVTGITKTAGRTKIYQAAIASPGTSANFQFAFQDGVADPRTELLEADRSYLPELRGRTHWLPGFTRLLRTTATSLGAALTEIDAAGANEPLAFLDDSTNTLYFSIVGGGDGTAANIYYASGAGLTAVTSATRESCGRLRIENIETRYGGIDLTPYRHTVLREVRFLGAKTNVLDYSSLHLEGGVELACAGALIALTGDGLNGKLGAKLTGGGLLSHHNNDDGFSPHEGNSCDLDGALFALNGGAASAVAYGADAQIRNARSFRNQRRADPITPANRYKPGAFAVVGSPSEEPNSDARVDTCAVYQSCISIEDYTSFYSDDATGDTAFGTAIDCKSIRPVEMGYNITRIVDCGYITSGTSVAKDTRVSVQNGTLVS